MSEYKSVKENICLQSSKKEYLYGQENKSADALMSREMQSVWARTYRVTSMTIGLNLNNRHNRVINELELWDE